MKRLSHHWSSLALALGIAAAVVTLQMILAPRLGFIEMKTLDVLLRATCPRHPALAVEVVDVGSDASRYEAFRHPGDVPPDGCSVPRTAYAGVTERLHRWGAKVIVFDLMFASHCKYEDAKLAAVFARAGNVIVCATSATKPGAVALTPPVSPLAQAVWGVCAPVAERPNGTIRSVPMTVQAANTGADFLALSLLGFLRFHDLKPADVKVGEGQFLAAGGTRVPTVPGEQISLLPFAPPEQSPAPRAQATGSLQVVSGSVATVPAPRSQDVMLIRWVGAAGTIPTRALWEVLAMNETQGRAAYHDKAVIIGRSASLDPGTLGYDTHLTTMGPMNGSEIHANALQTLLSGDFVRPLRPWVSLGLMALLALVTALATRELRGWRAVATFVVLAIFVAVLALELMARRGVWLYLFTGELGILLSWTLAEASESSKAARLLSQFVPSFLQKAEVRRPGEIRSVEATLLYSDIRSFTTTAEQLSSADTLGMLNVFHSAVEDLIVKHGGSIVKVPGDAVLAAFWRDHRSANHATCALRAARELLANLPPLARAWEAAGVKLEIGIGLSSGPVAMALVGKQHLEPTVIGDAVNVSARLEGLTKELGYRLILSRETQQLVQEQSGATDLGEVTVKGRQAPVHCYGLAEYQKAPDTGRR